MQNLSPSVKFIAGAFFVGAACCNAPILAGFLVFAGAGALLLDATA